MKLCLQHLLQSVKDEELKNQLLARQEFLKSLQEAGIVFNIAELIFFHYRVEVDGPGLRKLQEDEFYGKNNHLLDPETSWKWIACLERYDNLVVSVIKI